jgi:hypothetical protein
MLLQFYLWFKYDTGVCMIVEANPHGLKLREEMAGFHPCLKIKPLQSYFKPTARVDLKIPSPFLFSSWFVILPGTKHDCHHHLVP